jgi:DNA-binding NarL/FixJ family response regulator
MAAIPNIQDEWETLVRVLVVDDFEPFRRLVCSNLQKSPELQVVGEASDGLEAVQKSSEILPDLIVLDIGLPLLNGIEAARRIRHVSSKSKILFVSQECSAEVVQEALILGNGYIVKAHAGKELLTAVAEVRRGSQFIGEGVPSFGIVGLDLVQSPQSA